jgi:hypothetical protein
VRELALESLNRDAEGLAGGTSSPTSLSPAILESSQRLLTTQVVSQKSTVIASPAGSVKAPAPVTGVQRVGDAVVSEQVVGNAANSTVAALAPTGEKPLGAVPWGGNPPAPAPPVKPYVTTTSTWAPGIYEGYNFANASAGQTAPGLFAYHPFLEIVNPDQTAIVIEYGPLNGIPGNPMIPSPGFNNTIDNTSAPGQNVVQLHAAPGAGQSQAQADQAAISTLTQEALNYAQNYNLGLSGNSTPYTGCLPGGNNFNSRTAIYSMLIASGYWGANSDIYGNVNTLVLQPGEIAPLPDTPNIPWGNCGYDYPDATNLTQLYTHVGPATPPPGPDGFDDAYDQAMTQQLGSVDFGILTPAQIDNFLFNAPAPDVAKAMQNSTFQNACTDAQQAYQAYEALLKLGQGGALNSVNAVLNLGQTLLVNYPKLDMSVGTAAGILGALQTFGSGLQGSTLADLQTGQALAQFGLGQKVFAQGTAEFAALQTIASALTGAVSVLGVVNGFEEGGILGGISTGLSFAALEPIIGITGPAALPIAIGVAIISAIFGGNHDNPANMPDKYDTQRYGQITADLLGRAMEANGVPFNETPDMDAIFNNLSGVAAVEECLAQYPTINDAPAWLQPMYNSLMAEFGSSATGAGVLWSGHAINNQQVIGVPGTDGKIYQYTQLGQSLFDFANAYAVNDPGAMLRYVNYEVGQYQAAVAAQTGGSMGGAYAVGGDSGGDSGSSGWSGC